MTTREASATAFMHMQLDLHMLIGMHMSMLTERESMARGKEGGMDMLHHLTLTVQMKTEVAIDARTKDRTEIER